MLDPDDKDEPLVVVHRINEAICTTAGGPVSEELSGQWFPYPFGLLEKSAGDELHHRGCDGTRETFEGPGGAARDPKFEQIHCPKKRARKSADER